MLYKIKIEIEAKNLKDLQKIYDFIKESDFIKRFEISDDYDDEICIRVENLLERLKEINESIEINYYQLRELLFAIDPNEMKDIIELIELIRAEYRLNKKEIEIRG